MAKDSLNYAARNMIVSGHPLASAAGLEALQQGGTIVDAALAAAAVLTVVLPNACTIGGDAFMLIHRRGEGTVGLNGAGRCPSRQTVDKFPKGIPARGPNSAAIPALVRGWHDAHRRFGKLEWRAILRRAIQYADEGFAVSEELARAVQLYKTLLEKDPGCAAMFLRDGGLKAGTLFRQEALSATLKAIAENGPDAFFTGRVPESLSRRINALGGAFAPEDFKSITTEWVTPLSAEYDGLTVQVNPPNSYGLFLLLQLRLIARENFDWANASDDMRIAMLIRAQQRAFAVGDEYVADPDVAPRSRQPDIEAILDQPAETRPTPNAGGTAIVSVGDREGNGIVLVQSVFQGWGAVVYDPDTGILLNNRLSGFTTQPGHPNMIRPGRRPAHTLCPVIVLEGDRLRYLVSSPGGPGQSITITQVLTNIRNRHMSPSDAINVPRWSADVQGNLITEKAMPAAVLAKLNVAGISIKTGAEGVPYFGSAQFIERRDDGILAGTTDHRRDDCLLAG